MPTKKLLAFISLSLFLIFIFFSYLVAKETFTNIDFDTTVKLQDNLSSRVDLPFSILSVIGSAEITGIIWGLVCLYLLVRRKWRFLFFMPLFFLALAIEVFGKIFVEHPGPPFLFYRGVLDFNFPSHYVHTNYSYPSGHMTRTAFLVSLGITYLILRASKSSKLILGGILTLFLISMCISRIYLGEHWLSDVIGGALLGLSFGIIPSLFLHMKKGSA